MLATLEETGFRLLQARRQCRLTQKQLAARCGVPWQVLSRLERGHQDVAARRLALIAYCLGVSTDWLLGVPGAVPQAHD